MKLVFSPQSRKDLREIKSYIAISLSSPQAAENIVSKILKSCLSLKSFPNLGAEMKNKFDVDTDMRYLISSNYIVFYRKDNDTIKIIRILDARINYIKYLFDDYNED